MSKLVFYCGVEGCNAEIYKNHFFCNDHYALVSPYIRMRLKSSWNRGEPTNDYPEWRAKAIALAEKDDHLYEET